MSLVNLCKFQSRWLAFSLSAVACVWLFGCENGDNNQSSSDDVGELIVADGSSIIGTWSLTDSAGFTWYIHFGADGSWRITDDEAGNERRVFGSYTTSGDSFSGDMRNPGVGTGRISGSTSGTSISLDFVEYWHTPEKHVAYSGDKIGGDVERSAIPVDKPQTVGKTAPAKEHPYWK